MTFAIRFPRTLVAPLFLATSVVFPALVFAKGGSSGQAQYFANQKGVVVKMVPSPNKGKVIAEISGTALDVDGRAIELNIDRTQKPDVLFTRNIQGTTKYYLKQSPGSWEGLTVVGVEGEMGKVYFVPKMVKSVNGEQLIKQALFLRDANATGPASSFSNAAALFSKQCGYTIKTQIQPVVRSETKDTDSYCADALSGAAELCQDDLGKKALKSGLSHFSCAMGGKESVSFKNGRLSLVFTKDSASLKDDVTEILENSL